MRFVYTNSHHKYSFSRNKEKFFWMERNRLWLIMKNYKIATLIVLAPALLALEMMLLIYSIMHGWFLKKIRSYISFFNGLKNILANRKVVQKERKLSDKKFLKYMECDLEFSGMTEGSLIRAVNKFFEVYFRLVKIIIFW